MDRDCDGHVPFGTHRRRALRDRAGGGRWAANLGTLDFHPWPSRRRDVEHPDELRIDIDPQPGTTFKHAKQVAAIVHETLDELGWVGWPKTSGNRGIHVACRIEPKWGFQEVRRCALAFAREVERRAPKLVTTAWWKEERGKRVFIDYNQNARDRTIASAYSVRARIDATVSAPFRWDELDDVVTEDFTLATMPARFAELGDVQAGIDDTVNDLRKLFEWVEREEAAGEGEAPYPPNFPKMPGEPKRVQPSRAKKRASVRPMRGTRRFVVASAIAVLLVGLGATAAAGRGTHAAYDPASGDPQMGTSVAVSADGTTALVAAPGVAKETGAVYVFHAAGAGSWTSSRPRPRR